MIEIRKLILIFMGLLLVSIVCNGNSAKPYELPQNQGLVFDANSGIELIEEILTAKINHDNPNIIEYNAVYTMKAKTGSTQDFDVLFVLPEYETKSFEAYSMVVNQKNAGKVELIHQEDSGTINKIRNWKTNNKYDFIDPVSKQRIQSSDYFKGDTLANRFHVFIPEDGTIELHVSYKGYSGYYRASEVLNTIYSQVYFLSPAKFWDGDKKLTIRLDLRDFKTVEFVSSFDLVEKEPLVFEKHFDQIPEEEWVINYVDKKGLLLGTNQRSRHNMIVTIVLCGLMIALVLLKRTGLKAYKSFWWSIPPIGLVLLMYRPAYGTMFLLYLIFNPLTLLTIAIISCFVLISKRNQKVI